MSSRPDMEDAVSLAAHTTLGLGGAARHFLIATDEAAVIGAVAWADAEKVPLLVLGGGSNMVVGDGGFDGLALRLANRGMRFEHAGDEVLVHAAAGQPWDALVDTAVDRGLGGVECLSGIPGLVGATPIQNVGAYGQEVSETIRAVRALERTSGNVVELAPAACGFAYRESRFKREPHEYVVLGVTFALRPGAAPSLRYRELADAVAAAVSRRAPTLDDVMQTVRTLRRRKSMLFDPRDPNRHSVGSFFVNPVLGPAEAAGAVARAIAAGAAARPAEVPQFPAPGGAVKLSAGWLVERAGFPKGYRRGHVGVSGNHALALVHHGGGTTAELIALARDIRAGVAARFGVTLVPEPTLVNASWPA